MLNETTPTATEAGWCAGHLSGFWDEWRMRRSRRQCCQFAAKMEKKKRWRDLTGPDQQLERHAESKMRGQEHWKGGDREMKRERKKAPSKKSGWSITHIHPSLSLFFCQFFKGPKKTSWLNAQNLQEGMSRGYNLHAALYCQYKFMLWFIFIWFSSGFWMLCEYSKL